MKSNAKQSEDRLKNVLIADKHFNPESIKKVIQTDIYYLINNYADINQETLNFNIDIDKNGDYIFSFSAKSSRLKIFGSLPD